MKKKRKIPLPTTIGGRKKGKTNAIITINLSNKCTLTILIVWLCDDNNIQIICCCHAKYKQHDNPISDENIKFGDHLLKIMPNGSLTPSMYATTNDISKYQSLSIYLAMSSCQKWKKTMTRSANQWTSSVIAISIWLLLSSSVSSVYSKYDILSLAVSSTLAKYAEMIA